MTRTRVGGADHSDPHRTLDLGTEPVIHHRHHTVVHRVVVDDRPVVVKRARGRARVNLRAEAEVLGHLPTEATVRLVSIRETDDHTDLVLDDVGGCDLAAPGQLDVRSLRQALAETVELVGALHESGWVHGALCAEHVVLDPDHRPRLCSVGSARSAAPGDLEQERCQLVSLVAGALQRHADSDRPARERRVSRTLAERVRRSLDPTTPLDTDALVGLLEPTPEDDPGPRLRAMPRFPSRSELPLGAVAATIVLCGLAAVLVSSGAPHEEVPEVQVGLGVTRPETTPPPAPAGDAPARVAAGHVVERDGVQFTVGRAGDRVVLGDWDCAGTVTPALLRPRTGEIHLFDEWARPGAPVGSRLVSIHPGATDLEVDQDDCDRLQVRTSDGSIRPVGTVDTTTSIPNEEDDS